MIANSSHKGGCGCGGGSTFNATPCGCGGGGCAACQGQGLARPRFFAGQLLTEDDLQSLADYAVHKNRLHNRHLFGAGVVCGLEVTCHPCGEGRVIVHPGYALDCCGNDLVLECGQPLDINALVRDLRRDKLGGFDCKDPCPDPARPGNPAQQPVRYCLYLKYCERPSDPVTPYSTGESCGPAGCETTRVREGVKFELRCSSEQSAAHPLIARLCACLGDLNRFARILAAAQQLWNNTQTAGFTLKRDTQRFNATDILLLSDKAKTLNVAVDDFLRRPDVIPFELNIANRTTDAVAPPITERNILIPSAVADAAGETALLLSRFDALPPEERIKISENQNFEPAHKAAVEEIERVRSIVQTDSRQTFQQIRDWLIERLDNTPLLTDCTLRQRVYSITLPAPEQGPLGERGTNTLVSANQSLLNAYIDYLRDCVCRAFNPPCEPCNDSAVLLACLEVADCEVIKICNLERSLVLSPAAVRYWLPPLQLIGNLAERFCCDSLDTLLTSPANQEGHGFNDTRRRLDFGEILRQEVERILHDSLCQFPAGRDLVKHEGSTEELMLRLRQLFNPDLASVLKGSLKTVAKEGVNGQDKAERTEQTAAAAPAATAKPEAGGAEAVAEEKDFAKKAVPAAKKGAIPVKKNAPPAERDDTPPGGKK